MKTFSAQLKNIFGQYIFVGENLFSTSLLKEPISLKTPKVFLESHYTICIAYVSEFLFDNFKRSSMSSHPFALSFVNNIIKTALRSQQM